MCWHIVHTHDNLSCCMVSYYYTVGMVSYSVSNLLERQHKTSGATSFTGILCAVGWADLLFTGILCAIGWADLLFMGILCAIGWADLLFMGILCAIGWADLLLTGILCAIGWADLLHLLREACA